MSTNLEINREERLLRIALNRPEKRNALSAALCRELLAELKYADEDAAVGSILIEGNGESFCAGMDLSEILDSDAQEMAALHGEFFSFGQRMNKPVIACVHGAVMGGGVGLMANAHVVAAHEGTRIALTERRLGLWPYTIFSAVADSVGTRKATELALTARIITVEEAHNAGLVDMIGVEAGLAVAREIAAASVTAIADGLRFVRQIEGLDRAAVRRIAEEGRKRSQESEDFREGVLAFREKRKPAWPSHRG